MKKKIIIAEGVQRAVNQGNTLFGRGSLALFPAASCEDILALHRTHKADLIISEAELPSMGGMKLCAAIRRDPRLKDVSIIMACEAGDPSRGEYRQAGCNEVLVRPLDPVVLFSTVSRMLMVQNRLAARIPLRISIDGRDRNDAFVGISSDISASGMLLEAGRPLRSGERIECSFTVSSRVVSIECVVVRVQRKPAGGSLYGVKFLNLDAKNFVLIEHFVKSSLSRSETQQ